MYKPLKIEGLSNAKKGVTGARKQTKDLSNVYQLSRELSWKTYGFKIWPLHGGGHTAIELWLHRFRSKGIEALLQRRTKSRNPCPESGYISA